MKTMKKLLASALLVCILTAMLVVPAAAASGIVIKSGDSPVGDNLYYRSHRIGESLDFTAALDTGTPTEEFSWTTTGDSVTVTPSGIYKETATVELTKAGTTTVTVKYPNSGSELTKVLTFHVFDPTIKFVSPDYTIDLNTISSANYTVSVAYGGTVVATPTINWSIASSTSVGASINAAGTLTVSNPGSVTVQATYKDDNGKSFSATHNVTVVKPITGITIDNATPLSLTVGSTHTIPAVITPSTDYTGTLIWSSDDDTIASVDNNGLVTANAAGSTIIRLKSGTLEASRNVTVTDAPAVSITGDFGMELVFNHSEINETTISKTAVCDGAAGDFTWVVSGADVVKLVTSGANNSGCVITPKAVGTCEITVSRGAAGASVPAKIKITVKGPELDTFSLSQESLLLEAGKTHKLLPSITFKPGTDATDANKAVKWSVSPEGKGITVESDGTVKVAGGTAKDTEVTVTCTSLIDSTKSASCKVKVVTNAPAAGTLTLTASPNVISSVGGYSTLTAKAGNAVISNNLVSWSISGSSSGVATVNTNGVVSPKSSGDVIITGVYDDVANNIRYTGSVLVRIAPIIVYGNYGSYDRVNPLYFTTNEVIHSWNPAVDRIVVDGYVLTHGQHCYVGSSPDGHVMVALNPVFLNQLSPAVVHTVQIGDPAAPATGYFRTYGYSSTIYGVRTGDESQPALWAALCFMSILGASAILVSRRKDWCAKQ